VGEPENRDEANLVLRCRAGDADAFAALTERYRRELHVHCYRMLGSVTLADDALQESWLAAWQALPRFEGRSSVRTWLYAIATSRCLNAIRDGRRRPPPAPQPPFVTPEPTRREEVTWLQAYPDSWLDEDPAERMGRREHIALAFVAALQRLPPRQTAAVLLADVVGFSVADVAQLLDCSPTAAKGLIQRGRIGLAGIDEVAVQVSVDDRRLAERFAVALQDDDLDALLDLLTDDAWLAMPPAPHEYHGRAAIAGFLAARSAWRRPRMVRTEPVGMNRQPGFRVYVTGDRPDFLTGVMVLTPGGDRIRTITHFLADGV
jgi:RNA polymerase sigma-70 factor (ECF subfamily)